MAVHSHHSPRGWSWDFRVVIPVGTYLSVEVVSSDCSEDDGAWLESIMSSEFWRKDLDKPTAHFRCCKDKILR